MLDRVKRVYWDASKSAGVWHQALMGANDRTFRAVVLQDHLLRGRAALKPIIGETRERAAAAAAWLMRAQDATPDGGVSYGYFPVSNARGWDVSYPETTGYIMTSLLDYARESGQAGLLERVTRMAHWEAEVQMPSGAVQGGKVTTPDKQSAAAFNTGMVLDGFTTLLAEKDDPVIERAARRAADFLVGDMTEEGLFSTNGPFVSSEKVKIFNVLCARAMFRHGELAGSTVYRDAAVAAVEAALRFMTPNGWFRENCLSDPRRPLTHTIGYSLQGVLEMGVLVSRDDFVAAAQTGFDSILDHIQPNGFLAGRFDAGWRPAARWSCLTGSAQLAIVGYRLGEIIGDPKYTQAGDRLVNLLKAAQRIDTDSPGINGALAGSFPILGGYMQGGYPNWATKYFLDALILQLRH